MEADTEKYTDRVISFDKQRTKLVVQDMTHNIQNEYVQPNEASGHGYRLLTDDRISWLKLTKWQLRCLLDPRADIQRTLTDWQWNVYHRCLSANSGTHGGKRKGSPAGAEREAKTARLGDITTGDLEQQFQLYNDRAMAAQNKRLESLKQDVIAKVGESGRTLCEEVVDVQKGLAAMHTALDDLKQSQATAHTHVLHAIDSSRNDQKAFTEKLHRDIGSR
ncbi:hypothetical protein CIB48_g818 [Xylaria polymorpha]|nr:hypothetical protein CIB48_g818 [Xylaria polymorpha]